MYLLSILGLLFFLCPLNMHAQSAEKAKKTNIANPVPDATSSISSNPAAVNATSGSGALQDYLEKKLGISNNHGISLQGAWIGDSNRLFSGGIQDAKKTTSNSVGLLDLSIDMQKFNGWKGGLFSIQFLQQNAENTNGQAGVIQGYNSLPDVYPFNRSELYALWYRQAFFDDRFFLRIGKTITTLDFNNMVKPVALDKGDPNIPAVTGLIYTPIFINPAVDGVMPGYTNTAYGITANFTPVKAWYLSYGIYDGSLASGKQTGLMGPTFNGAFFQVLETGSDWRLGKNGLPGTLGLGLWHQSGLIRQAFLTENAATGVYLFGSQRLWYKHPGHDTSGISGFYQYGINNSSVLPMNQSIGAGLTAFGLVADREYDSLGAGFSLVWLNQRITDRKTELMFQIYYQAKIIKDIYLQPVLSYVPDPGQNRDLNPVFAGTLRVIVLI